MQNIIIGYATIVSDTCRSTDCSIAAAVERHLQGTSRAALLKLREAADDLHRIVNLELGRRDEHAGECDGTLDYNEQSRRAPLKLEGPWRGDGNRRNA